MSSRPLTREDILRSADLPQETLDVPRWGGTIVVKAVPTAHPRYVQYWSGTAKEHLSDEEKQVRRFVGAAIMAAYDSEGKERLFKFTDADELREKHYNSVIQVANLGLSLAGNTEREETALTLNALMRVANHAQAHDWPEEQQDAIAGLIAHLMTGDAEPATDDDEDAQDGPLDQED